MTESREQPCEDFYVGKLDLDEAEIDNLTKQLVTEPDRIDLRLQLLGYWHDKDESKFASQLNWFIRILPLHPIHEIAYPLQYNQRFDELHSLWAGNLVRESCNANMLHHAACFCRTVCPEKSRELWLRALELEPSNPTWRFELVLLAMQRANRYSTAPMLPFAKEAFHHMHTLWAVLMSNPEDALSVSSQLNHCLFGLASLAINVEDLREANVFAEYLDTHLFKPRVSEQARFALLGKNQCQRREHSPR